MVYEGCFISDFIVSEKKRMKNEKLLNMKKIFNEGCIYSVSSDEVSHSFKLFYC